MKSVPQLAPVRSRPDGLSQRFFFEEKGEALLGPPFCLWRLTHFGIVLQFQEPAMDDATLEVCRMTQFSRKVR